MEQSKWHLCFVSHMYKLSHMQKHKVHFCECLTSLKQGNSLSLGSLFTPWILIAYFAFQRLYFLYFYILSNRAIIFLQTILSLDKLDTLEGNCSSVVYNAELRKENFILLTILEHFRLTEEFTE